MNAAAHLQTSQPSGLERSERTDRQQFLMFQLQPDLMAAIEIDRVVELINIQSDRVVPMPHLPPAVLGVYNWRGEILWIVDVAKLLGKSGSPRRYRSLQPLIVIDPAVANEASGQTASERQAQTTIGLIVDEIVEIEWWDLDSIQAPVPDRLDPELSKWAWGLWATPTGADLLILDLQKIFGGGSSCPENRTDFQADC